MNKNTSIIIDRNTCKNKLKSIPDDRFVETPKNVRTNYDECNLEYLYKESKGPGLYYTQQYNVPRGEDLCHMEFPGYVADATTGINPSQIDLESKLRTYHIKYSKCPDVKNDLSIYNTYREVKQEITECEHKSFNKSSGKLIPEYSRSKKSCNVNSGSYLNRFEPFCIDLQQLNRIHSNDYIGLDTRQLAKYSLKK
jgi:hypothetical protein